MRSELGARCGETTRVGAGAADATAGAIAIASSRATAAGRVSSRLAFTSDTPPRVDTQQREHAATGRTEVGDLVQRVAVHHEVVLTALVEARCSNGQSPLVAEVGRAAVVRRVVDRRRFAMGGTSTGIGLCSDPSGRHRSMCTTRRRSVPGRRPRCPSRSSGPPRSGRPAADRLVRPPFVVPVRVERIGDRAGAQVPDQCRVVKRIPASDVCGWISTSELYGRDGNHGTRSARLCRGSCGR